MSAGEFDGRPLVAGSMVGLRSFRVDGLGRLMGVVKQQLFRPGDNTADCLASPSPGGWVYAGWECIRSAPAGVTAQKRVPAPPHRVGQLGCTCGYYAYYTDEANPNHVAGTVEAVIEGWGTVTTGSKGFRAEKAKLVALIEPRVPWWMTPIRRVRQYASGLVGTGTLLLVCAPSLGVFVGLLAMLGAGILGAALLFVGVVAANADAPGPLPWWLVLRNYPDVPVYRTHRAALKAHPLTVPIPPDPQSDPEFWTRDA